MQIRALKTFSSNLGLAGEPKQLVRTGLIITVPDHYGKQLIAGKLAALHNPEAQPLEPQRNTDLGGAPRAKDGEGEGEGEGDEGNGSCDDEAEVSETEQQETESSQDQDDSSEDSSSEAPPAAGRSRRSSSQRPGRRSRKRT